MIPVYLKNIAGKPKEQTHSKTQNRSILETKKLVVVQFWSPYCPHCRAIKPVFDELASEYGDKLKFTKINAADNPENQHLAAKHGIMGTPTFLFFCGGRLINGVVGALEKEDLEQTIEFTIAKHRDCNKKNTPLRLAYIS